MNGLMASMLIAMTTICSQIQDVDRTATDESDRGQRLMIWDLDIARAEFQSILDNPGESRIWTAALPAPLEGRVAGVRLKVDGAPNEPDRTRLPSGATLRSAKSLLDPNRIFFDESDISALQDGGLNFGVAIPEQSRNVETYKIIYRPSQKLLDELQQDSRSQRIDSDRDAGLSSRRQDDTRFGSNALNPISASRESQSNIADENGFPRRRNRSTTPDPNDFVGPRQNTTGWGSTREPNRESPNNVNWPDRQTRDDGFSALDQLELDGGFQRPGRPTGNEMTTRRNGGMAPIRDNQSVRMPERDNNFSTPTQEDPELIRARRRNLENQKELQRLKAQRDAIEKRKLEQENDALERQKLRSQWELEQQEKELRRTGLVNNNYQDLNPTNSFVTPRQSITATRDRMAFNPGLDNFSRNYINERTAPPNRMAALDTTPKKPFNPADITPVIQVKSPSENIEGEKDLTKKTAATTQSKNDADAPTAFLLLMFLLLSIGLNIFLAWISRGFYVRYNDLADELRDTFNATSV